MKSIKFIVPYFGTLPNYFQVWLDSCANNPTINWLVFTDDKTVFRIPANVEIIYTSFKDIQDRVRSIYSFPISLKTAYKLCDYKVAYGEIFSEYLEGFDFWGYCDVDLIWGNIRHFYTENLLDAYDKVGCQGHCAIFRNNSKVNSTYRRKVDGCINYEEAFSVDKICCTDVGLINKAFKQYAIPSYNDTIYAGLHKYESGFYLQGFPKEDGKYNKRQVFLLENGNLYRYYMRDNDLTKEEFLYIHFFSRPMKNKITDISRVLIYPDCYKSFDGNVDVKLVNKYGKKNIILYYTRVFRQNKNRLSPHKILSFFKIKKKYDLSK